MISKDPSSSGQFNIHSLRAYYMHKEAIIQFLKTTHLQMVHMVIILENSAHNTIFNQVSDDLLKLYQMLFFLEHLIEMANFFTWV